MATMMKLFSFHTDSYWHFTLFICRQTAQH